MTYFIRCKVELNRLKTSLGELLSVISFLSTNTEREREKALEFAISRSPPNDQLTSALLEISVDLNSTTKPFAGIEQFGAFAEEEEVLFMFATIFRIDDVSQDEKNKNLDYKIEIMRRR
ncbi:unnamed protein product [Rotaria socialis]|uniref:Uncharacterized protein n=1 Tax=Rotaria socialis TaxID=392032 RepID=A0A820TSN3_9BILA|nr:unnamed protein product [Rotaria socialis]CAF4470590.1 unnamed protein product [Rotaria socialis]